MIHEIFPVGPLQCNCSIVGDEQTKEAMVIDPGDEIDDVMARLRRHQLTVKQIIVTHAHIDHVGGAMKLKRLTGAPILLNQNDYALLKMLDVQASWIGMPAPEAVNIDASVGTGDKVQAGRLTADVLHTPGHTEGSICLYFAPEKKLIAGRYSVRWIDWAYRPAGWLLREDHAVVAWAGAGTAGRDRRCARTRSAYDDWRGAREQPVLGAVNRFLVPP